LDRSPLAAAVDADILTSDELQSAKHLM